MKWYEKIGVTVFIVVFCVFFVYAYSEFNSAVIHRWLNVTNDITVGGYYYGQPLDGSIGSGIINSSSNVDDCGCITMTDNGGLSVTYPALNIRLVNRNDNSIKNCSLPSATINPVTDELHSVYYVDSNCAIQNTPFATYIDIDIDPGNYARIFDVKATGGDIEILKGASLINFHDRKSKRVHVKENHLRIVEGITLEEGTFPDFNITLGEHTYINTIVATTKEQASLNGTHLIGHSGGDVIHYTDTGLNLTTCDDGTDNAKCGTNVYRRYLLGISGWQLHTRIHQIMPLTTDTTYTTLTNCLDTVTSALEFTMPAGEEYSFVKTYVYCGKRDDSAWRDGWIRLDGGINVGTGAIDTSAFIVEDGSNDFTGNQSLGGNSLLNVNVTCFNPACTSRVYDNGTDLIFERL